MVVQFAKLTGADVIAVARGKRHRELAMELGSARVLDDIAAAGEVKMIAETFPLEDAPKALQRLKRGDIEARAALVM